MSKESPLAQNKVGPIIGKNVNETGIAKSSIGLNSVNAVKETEQVETQETIPVRSTIVSAILILVYLIFFIFAKFVSERRDNIFFIKVTVEIFLIVRCPLTTFLTYRSTKKPLAMII